MIVEFDKSFSKSIRRLDDKSICQKLEVLINALETGNSLSAIPNLKKLSGYQNYFRIRIGDYRVGLEKIDDYKIRMIVVAHRKDIYKIFP